MVRNSVALRHTSNVLTDCQLEWYGVHQFVVRVTALLAIECYCIQGRVRAAEPKTRDVRSRAGL